MFCEKCGNKNENGAKFCQFCGSAITNKNNGSHETVAAPEFGNIAENGFESKLTLMTSRYATIKTLSTYISTEICLKPDRMEISTIPKSYNKTPVIMYDDIVDISYSNKLFALRTGIATLFLIADIIYALNDAWGILFLLLVIYFAYKSVNREIVLSLRGGNTVRLYCHEKSDAVKFKNNLTDMISKRFV